MKFKNLFSVIVLCLLCGCQSYIEHRGKFLDDADLKFIVIHKTKKADIVAQIGESTLEFANGREWIYLGQRFERKSFFDPKILDTRVFIIEFDESGIVSNKRTIYPKAINKRIDGEKTLIDEENISIWQQLLNNYRKMGERSANRGTTQN